MQKCEHVLKRDLGFQYFDFSFYFLPAAGIPAAAAAAYAAYAAGRGFSAAAAGYPGFGIAQAATGGLDWQDTMHQQVRILYNVKVWQA